MNGKPIRVSEKKSREVPVPPVPAPVPYGQPNDLDRNQPTQRGAMNFRGNANTRGGSFKHPGPVQQNYRGRGAPRGGNRGRSERGRGAGNRNRSQSRETNKQPTMNIQVNLNVDG